MLQGFNWESHKGRGVRVELAYVNVLGARLLVGFFLDVLFINKT